MSSFETMLLERSNTTATLTINHPDRANVLSQATMQELSQALDAVATDDTVRSVIITGADERVFVGGADIHELRELTAVSARTFIRKLHLLIEKYVGWKSPSWRRSMVPAWEPGWNWWWDAIS